MANQCPLRKVFVTFVLAALGAASGFAQPVPQHSRIAQAKPVADPRRPVAQSAADEVTPAQRELRRLMADAEEVFASAGASEASLARVESALDGLQAALSRKAVLLRAGSPSDAADVEITERQQELRLALESALGESAGAAAGAREAGEGIPEEDPEEFSEESSEDDSDAAAEEYAEEDDEAPPDEPGDTAGGGGVRDFVDWALDTIERVQELRAASRDRGAEEDETESYESTGEESWTEGEAGGENDEESYEESREEEAQVEVPDPFRRADPTPREARWGEVAGTVRAPSGVALRRASVELRPGAGAGPVERTSTDEEGGYLLRALPGAYRLVVRKSGFRESSRSVRVPESRRAREDFSLRPTVADPRPNLPGDEPPRAPAARAPPTLPPAAGPSVAVPPSPRNAPTPVPLPASAELTGRVIDRKTGKPIADALVAVDGRTRARTDRGGAYVIRGLAAGAANIRVTRPGFASAQENVTLRRGPNEIRFALRRKASAG